MKKSLIYLFFLPVFFFASCDDIIIENTPANVFEVFWRTMDENYVFFEEKGVDWDEIYRIYAPKARAARNDEDLRDILEAILPLFQDGHLWIGTGSALIVSCVAYAFFWNDNRVDLLTANGFETVHSEQQLVILEHKKKQIAYFKLNTFFYQQNGLSTNNPENLLKSLDFSNGLIIDLMHNGGGCAQNARNFISAFFTDRKIVEYTQHKTGRGRNDFSDKIPRIRQGKGYVPNDVPLIILISPGTFSAGNSAVYMLADLRNSTVIGAPTSGGGGSPRTTVLPNGWILTFPHNKHFSSSGRNMEFRFEPDIKVASGSGRMALRDSILVAALDYLTPNP